METILHANSKTLAVSGDSKNKSKNIFKITAAFFILLIIPQYGNGQSASATWSLTASSSVTVTGSVVSSAMTYTTGISTVAYNTTDGVNSQGWNSAGQDANDYYQFTISPLSGYRLTVNNIYATTGRSGTSGNALWQYSFNSSLDTLYLSFGFSL